MEIKKNERTNSFVDKVMFPEKMILTSEDVFSLKTKFIYNKQGALINAEIEEVSINDTPIIFKRIP